MRYKVLIVVFPVSIVFYFFSLPKVLFNDPCSTVIHASNGELLSASIATDGQWRFPQTDTLPVKFVDALVTFEDKRFLNHPGVDFFSLGRALKQNISRGKVVSGASTITMQVIRLSRKNKSRSVYEKVIEMILATRLELRYSKNEILSIYASHTPFGGNVVGLDAACWRYFGTSPEDLSWAQAALLAVLPNAPALIHPGRNRNELKLKRDRLLDKLKEAGKLDDFTCQLSKEEPLPDEPYPLPRHARHLLTRASAQGLKGKKLVTTIDYPLQQRTEDILTDHHERLRANKIFNVAALILDVKTGSVLTYVGNVGFEKKHGSDVDIINAPRSTGSILKPFLYAAMMDDGKMLPKTLLPDVPIYINGFSPKNFSHEFDGAVNADRALIRSLNVPAVHMLKDYRYERFHHLLTRLGMSTLKKDPDHYGLSLILGGAEGTLWDITGMYASMARTLNNFFERPGKNKYNKNDIHNPSFIKAVSNRDNQLEQSSLLSASSIYLTFDALKEVYRPGEESGWKYFSSSKKIAWKTGTSFGFRDAWAVGVTPQYAIGIWVGNADGEGRPGLTGTEAAAPILFDIFSQLNEQTWFQPPAVELEDVAICDVSGFRASEFCTVTDIIQITKEGLSSSACPYHKMIHVTKDQKFQVNSACSELEEMKHLSWFVLPPVQEYYYRSINMSYKPLPPFKKECQMDEIHGTMDMVYPKDNARLFIPRDLDGKPGSSVFHAAHRNPNNSIYWHIDGKYVGTTQTVHQLAVNPGYGKHTITLVDASGQTLTRKFEIISEM